MSKWQSHLATLAGAAALVVLLAACDETGDSDTDAFIGEPESPGDANGSDEGVSSVANVFITGDNELETGEDGRLALQVVVTDDRNRVVEGVYLQPNTEGDSGLTVGPAQPRTDEGGRAVLELTTHGDPTNRSIDFSVEADGVRSSVFPVDIVGTTLSSTSLSLEGNGGTVDFRLVDGSGGVVPREALAYTFEDPVVLSDDRPVETDLRGEGAVDFEAAGSAGEYRFEVESAGATFTQFWTVASENLELLEPAGETFWEINQDHEIRARLTGADGEPMDGEIRFRSTRGTLSDDSVDTGDDGIASVTISAPDIGPARIEAEYEAEDGTVVTSGTALFVSRDADSLNLQAEPATVGVEETSRIIARVLDENDQPVQGVKVDFQLEDNTGGALRSGTAETDAFGRAEVLYEAGSYQSADEGVKVTARVDVVDDDTVFLTVTAEALYITLGTGNTLRDVDDTTYGLPYTAVVTDSAGRPVANRELSLSLWSTDYRRGRWEPDGSRWVQNVTWECPTEDPERTGNVGDNDVSGTGSLLPGNVASLVPDGGTAQGHDARIKTDENGFASFEIRYPKDSAQWVRTELRASIEVGGTEGTRTRSFWLPIAADDIDDVDVDPPGRVSPFGTGEPDVENGCIAFEEDWQEDKLN